MLTRNLRRREHGVFRSGFSSAHQVTPEFVSRLDLERTLKGHEGCVNCIEWNQAGSLLASGSDDFKLIIWRPFSRDDELVQKTVTTGHQGNIFGLKFMPHTNDSILASGAGDCQVRVHDADKGETLHVFTPHCSRVKRLEVAHSEPHLLWSAGEDGLVMQFDLRCSSDHASVLVNLNGLMGKNAEAKCLSINPVRNELLAVGANDPYVRIYDRRKIKTQDVVTQSAGDGGSLFSFLSEYASRDHFVSKSREVPYSTELYAAGHLPGKETFYRKRLRPLAATYITFSPDGKDLLVNLGGEQVYLFSELNRSLPILAGYKDVGAISAWFDAQFAGSPAGGEEGKKESKSKDGDMSADVMDMKLKANKLYEGKLFNQAIELYNSALVRNYHPILLANRAAALMKRNWDGDIYGALRDCHATIRIDKQHVKAHLRVVRCLLELNMIEESRAYLSAFKGAFPDHANSSSCLALESEVERKISKKKRDAAVEGHKSTTRNGRRRRSNSNEDDQDSMADSSDPELGAMQSSEPSSSPVSTLTCYDYNRRYCGHCNTTTDIKEANFFGRYIVAGSDDGKFFIWERESTNIAKILIGDDSIVNCLQSHPTSCILATSGIESSVKLWMPQPTDGGSMDRFVEDSDEVAAANQRRMNADPFETLLINMGYDIQHGNLGSAAANAAVAAARRGSNSTDEEEGEEGNSVQCRQS